MKQFNGYADAKKAAENSGRRLPAGGYICKIMGVRYETFDWGDRIVLQFDITEGEYKDFFKQQFEANTQEDKKWKGVARISVPSDDGSERDEKTKKRFANWTTALEKSNSGYVWDWDEKKWKGKSLGILFRETGTVIDGKEITYTEAVVGCSIEEVKKGTYWKGYTKFYAKDGYTGTAQPTSSVKENEYGFVQVDEDNDEGLPF